MSLASAILIGSALVAVPLIVLGVRIRFGRAFELIAGYNRASREEQAKYDIDGLADHLGNGLLTLAVLLLSGAAAMALGYETAATVALGLFLSVAFLVVIGGQKFLPAAQHPAPGRPPGAFQRMAKRVLPAAAFQAIEEGTRQWLIECPCGARRDLWDAGGIRHMGVGEPRQWRLCPACGKATWQRIRRRSEAERLNGVPSS